MSCENQRERLALRLYDELDETESTRLERHLADCADCRAFALELADGLGALALEIPRTELPPGWRERLDASTAPTSLVGAGRGLWTFVAGLAAGLVLMTMFSPDAPDPGTSEHVAAPTGTASSPGERVAFTPRDTPPPHATGGGSFSRLSELLDR